MELGSQHRWPKVIRGWHVSRSTSEGNGLFSTGKGQARSWGVVVVLPKGMAKQKWPSLCDHKSGGRFIESIAETPKERYLLHVSSGWDSHPSMVGWATRCPCCRKCIQSASSFYGDSCLRGLASRLRVGVIGWGLRVDPSRVLLWVCMCAQDLWGLHKFGTNYEFWAIGMSLSQGSATRDEETVGRLWGYPRGPILDKQTNSYHPWPMLMARLGKLERLYPLSYLQTTI